MEPAPDELPNLFHRTIEQAQKVHRTLDEPGPGRTPREADPTQVATDRAAGGGGAGGARRARAAAEDASTSCSPSSTSWSGSTAVKAEIHRQAAVLRVEGLRKDAGLAAPTITRHLIFNGNPGTGKTTVARLVAGIYRALGLLSKGQLVEVDRSELVAGYLGQTAMKTADVVKSAEGGVLFIDEAYSLSGDQYGTEAIDTLVKEMEDKRDDLVVIVAGYPVPMAVFISQNPGLESRFRTTIDFVDYTDDELVQIFEVLAKAAEYDVDEPVLDRLRELLGAVQRGPTFGNARYVRNVLEAAIGRHAWRLREIEKPTVEELRRLTPDDLDTVEEAGVGPTEPVEWEPAPMDRRADQGGDVTQAQQAPAAAAAAQTVATVGTPMPAPRRVEDVPRLLNRLQVAAVARLPGLRRPRRDAAVPRLAGQRPGRRQHRAAGAGAGDPVLAAPRGRAGHQRLPRRRARAGRAAGGVRRGARRRAPPDHRRRRGAAGRPRGAGGAQQRGRGVRERDRPGPRQQPPGFPDRVGVPPGGRSRPASRGAPDHPGAG